MIIKFLVSSSASALQTVNPHITIEAEYGDTVVEGSLLTMAHHGSRSNNPPPCSGKYIIPPFEGDIVVGLSHIDLDTIGGCIAISRGILEYQSFWDLAAFVDINGVHKISQSGASEKDIDRLNAWFAFNEKNRFSLPKGEEVVDATYFIINCVVVLSQILDGNDTLLARGKEWANNQEALNKESFVDYQDGVLIRVSPKFVNHLYTSPTGSICNTVVGFNTLTGAITLSFADTTHKNACKIMQKVFGAEAGGHKGIAGSPRGKRCSFDSIFDVIREVME